MYHCGTYVEMLYTRVELPTGEGAVHVEEWLQTVCHLHVLTPIILSLPKELSPEQHELIQQLIRDGLLYAIDSINLANEELYEIGLKWLDSGLPVLLFDLPTSAEGVAYMSYALSQLPRQRVGISQTSSLESESALNALFQQRGLASQLHFRLSSNDIQSGLYLESIDKQIKAAGCSTVDVFVYVSNDGTSTLSDVSSLGTRNEHLHIVLVPRLRLEEDAESNSSLKYFQSTLKPLQENDVITIDIVDLYISLLKCDRVDGLYTTLVCDVYDRVLGLVYSSKESIRIAFLSLRGVYFSRSRQSLWKKGESSGMHQILLSMHCDCDRDAIKMVVEQQGQPPVFCHLLTRTCFGEDHGISKLERVLQDRLVNAPPGSYTQRLYQDKDLLQKKLLEEVQELIEATSKEDIASEAADVMYFMMVRCVSAGVTMADMERWLDKRSLKINRRPGNAKEWRTQEAEKILKSTASSSNNQS